jgi:hypothetical protein
VLVAICKKQSPVEQVTSSWVEKAQKHKSPCMSQLTTDSTEWSVSWECHCLSASLLRNPTVHFRVNKSPIVVAILRQLNPFYIVTQRYILVLPSHPHSGLSSGSSFTGLGLNFRPHFLCIILSGYVKVNRLKNGSGMFQIVCPVCQVYISMFMSSPCV